MQNKGSTSEQKEPTTDPPLKLGKDSKLAPQECQHCLDNKLCLFCGTAGHIMKDCMKVASSKAHSAKTKQENSPSPPFRLPRKTMQSPRLHMTWVLHWSPLQHIPIKADSQHLIWFYTCQYLAVCQNLTHHPPLNPMVYQVCHLEGLACNTDLLSGNKTLCHLVGPFHGNCTQDTAKAHPLQFLNWQGIEQQLSGNCCIMTPSHHPLSRQFCHQHP